MNKDYYKVLMVLLEVLEQDIKLRSAKGYGAHHPVLSRKPFTGLGKSKIEYMIDKDTKKEKPKKKKSKKIRVSKAYAYKEEEDDE